MIFNIQKCSIHDGHGLRTVVFLKGCPLRCKWCANPESQIYQAEIMESQGKCIGCGVCIKECPENAIHLTNEGPQIDRDKCISCFRCVEHCYAGAKYIEGKEYSIDELYKEIKKDKIFYDMKGGGVTFSGGEPLTQPGFLKDIAKKCHESGINVQIESCGYGEFKLFKEVLPYVDGMFIDLKHMNTKIHRELTGIDNAGILKNIKAIDDYGMSVIIRTPVIPNCNDSKENIEASARFIKTLSNVKEYELLPYHQFGINKYKALGREYLLTDTKPPTDEEIRDLVKYANDIFKGTDKVCYYTKNNNREIVR
ncbi:glycyl-radical enzyme activating protein [Wukongibacter baidiensis]|uniref:glycyl-radical enzyme activating protein n=1 Tax=Wukongibacter baidiensis TaxID=1723361 RepID=UPI003D7FF6A3